MCTKKSTVTNSSGQRKCPREDFLDAAGVSARLRLLGRTSYSFSFSVPSLRAYMSYLSPTH